MRKGEEYMAIKLSNVQIGSACTVIEIKGGLRVRRYLAKLGVLPRGEGVYGNCEENRVFPKAEDKHAMILLGT